MSHAPRREWRAPTVYIRYSCEPCRWWVLGPMPGDLRPEDLELYCDKCGVRVIATYAGPASETPAKP